MRIHRIVDPMINSNVYLIEADQPVLIDAGSGATVEQILALIRSTVGDRLSALVLTHGHVDHVGGVADVLAAYDVPVYLHPAEADAHPDAEPMPEQIDCGDRRFDALHTPGHSPGGVCLYDSHSKTLIAGDTVFPGGRAGRWDLPGADHAALVRSVRELNELDVRALYPGHYDPLTTNVAAHLRASLGTLEAVGERFDDDAYDRRIEALQGQL